MNSRDFKEAALVIVFLISATVLIAYTNTDIITSSYFFIDGQWPIGDQHPWKFLYKLDRIPSFILAIIGLAGFVISFFRPEKHHWAKPGIFLFLLLVIGPGLIVNATFKDHWGRPRPREIVQFQGKKEFLQPWQKGIDGNGRSFPSGHTSAAFYMTAPYFIYRRNNKKKARNWLIGGTIFAVFMSIARITQGGHFLSDTIWACGMVYLTALLLSALLKLDKPTATSSVPTE